MKYLSLFSGIEAASVAWRALNWTPLAFAENEPFCGALLAHHYPDVENLGDVTKAKWEEIDQPDLIVFGSPCQSFSVAGKRAGLDDARGILAFVGLGVVRTLKPKWVVFENVPGLLSSGRGRDFGSFVGGLGQLGYGWAYRILDAQHFGVPQRRRRVFVVGYLGDWRPAAAVLFERDCLSGNSAPRRETGKDIAYALNGSSGGDSAKEQERTFVASARMTAFGQYEDDDSASALKTRDYKDATDLVITHALDAFSAGRMTEDGTGRGCPVVPILEAGARTGRVGHEDVDGLGVGEDGDPMFTLQSGKQHAMAVAFESRYARNGRGAPAELVPCLKAESGSTGKGDSAPLVFDPTQLTHPENRSRPQPGGWPSLAKVWLGPPGLASAVRRLTPRECERLQGFPDDYTRVKYRGKIAADGPRYRALGNSMAVPVMAWIGRRIQMVEAVIATRQPRSAQTVERS